MTELNFADVAIPTDSAPTTVMPEGTTSYDPEYPGSTEEAPYGYKPDGTPYKRRPNGGGRPKGSGGSKGGRVNESTARAAAGLLAQINNLVGVSLTVFGFPMTAAALVDANARFETMATEALKTDPALCKKIMSAGSTSGKTALIMAYGVMGANAFPAMRAEIAQRKAMQEDEEYREVS